MDLQLMIKLALFAIGALTIYTLLVLISVRSYKNHKLLYKKGAFTGSMKILFVTAILLLLPSYRIIDRILYHYEFNSFDITIGDTMDEIDFSSLYTQLYTNSRSDTPLLANFDSDSFHHASVYVKSDGTIARFSLSFTAFRNNHYYVYGSTYSKGVLHVSTTHYNTADYQSTFHDLMTYFERLDTFPYTGVILSYLESDDFQEGMQIEINYCWEEESSNRTLGTDFPPEIEIFAIDESNSIQQDGTVLLENHYLLINVSPLREVSLADQGVMIDDRKYVSSWTHIQIYVTDWVN